MKELTKEQKEYITMKQSFDSMLERWYEYREVVNCCKLNNRNERHAKTNFTVEDVFYNLLDNHQKQIEDENN